LAGSFQVKLKKNHEDMPLISYNWRPCCVNLEVLNLSGTDVGNDAVMRQILSVCKKIRVLLLASNPITNATLRLIGDYEPSSLKGSVSFLLNCNMLTLHTNTTLEILDLSEIADITHRDVEILANHCTNLRLLVLKYTICLTM
jgi:hypothetical protein